MAARKSESRIPAGFQVEDLGQAVVADDGRTALVSFISSPIGVNRENSYVLFVTDTSLAAAAQTFEWKFVESEGLSETSTTQEGEIFYRPQTVGTLEVTVRILGAGGAKVGNLTLEQAVLPLNKELERTIWNRFDQPGPAIGNLDVARELVNDHNPYYQGITSQAAEQVDAFRRLVFGFVHNGALQCPPAQRKRQIDQLAASLNGDGYDFPALIAQGVGVCGIRLPLLAMSLPAGSLNTFLKWTELPEPQIKRSSAESQLLQACAGLAESIRLDLFNLARFPKSNIALCGRIVELLRDRHFPGASFHDVMTGMSGARALSIIKHFRQGPFQKGRN